MSDKKKPLSTTCLRNHQVPWERSISPFLCHDTPIAMDISLMACLFTLIARVMKGEIPYGISFTLSELLFGWRHILPRAVKALEALRFKILILFYIFNFILWYYLVLHCIEWDEYVFMLIRMWLWESLGSQSGIWQLRMIDGYKHADIRIGKKTTTHRQDDTK